MCGGGGWLSGTQITSDHGRAWERFSGNFFFAVSSLGAVSRFCTSEKLSWVRVCLEPMESGEARLGSFEPLCRSCSGCRQGGWHGLKQIYSETSFSTFGFQRQRLFFSSLYFLTESFWLPSIFACVPPVLLLSGTVVNGRWRSREALFSWNSAGIGRWLRTPREER